MIYKSINYYCHTLHNTIWNRAYTRRVTRIYKEHNIINACWARHVPTIFSSPQMCLNIVWFFCHQAIIENRSDFWRAFDFILLTFERCCQQILFANIKTRIPSNLTTAFPQQFSPCWRFTFYSNSSDDTIYTQIQHCYYYYYHYYYFYYSGLYI